MPQSVREPWCLIVYLSVTCSIGSPPVFTARCVTRSACAAPCGVSAAALTDSSSITYYRHKSPKTELTRKKMLSPLQRTLRWGRPDSLACRCIFRHAQPHRRGSAGHAAVLESFMCFPSAGTIFVVLRGCAGHWLTASSGMPHLTVSWDGSAIRPHFLRQPNP